MSRSGYSDDYGCDEEFNNALDLYRQSVNRALQGKRGQAFLRELLEALDALPRPRLIADELVDAASGEVCAIGSVGKARGLDMSHLDYGDPRRLSRVFGIAPSMVAEIEYVNDDDDGIGDETPEQRFQRVRAWVVGLLVPTGT